MRINDEIDKCKRLVEFDKEMLVHRIAESLIYHFHNKKLSDEDIFLCGLRYSEFLANGTSDSDYVAAERRRMKYLEKIGITPQYLRIVLKDVYGIA